MNDRISVLPRRSQLTADWQDTIEAGHEAVPEAGLWFFFENLLLTLGRCSAGGAQGFGAGLGARLCRIAARLANSYNPNPGATPDYGDPS